jgi:hypothetical protein
MTDRNVYASSVNDMIVDHRHLACPWASVYRRDVRRATIACRDLPASAGS